MLERYGVMSVELTEALAQITDAPIDIEAIELSGKKKRRR